MIQRAPTDRLLAPARQFPGVREGELKGLLQAMEEFELETGTIITRDHEAEEQHQGKTIRFTPLWQWLCNQ